MTITANIGVHLQFGDGPEVHAHESDGRMWVSFGEGPRIAIFFDERQQLLDFADAIRIAAEGFAP